MQEIAVHGRLPELRKTLLSEEVRQSRDLAPVSHVIRSAYPSLITFGDYFESPESGRRSMRTAVEQIDPKMRYIPSSEGNYEAHHPPLAYAVLAIPEKVLGSYPLTTRVLIERVLAGLLAAVLLLFAAERLAHRIGLTGPYLQACLFCVFSSQMLYATVVHIANDWLAVPLLALFLAYAMDNMERADALTALSWGASARRHF